MQQTEIFIIGGGPAGYHLAITLGKAGKSVCVAEKKHWGGVCLNAGCVPSKTLLDIAFKIKNARKGWGVAETSISLDFEKLHLQKNAIIQKLNQGILALFKQHKVQNVLGKAHVLRKNTFWEIEVNGEIWQSEHLVVATGSIPKPLPFLPFDHQNIWDNQDALNFKTLPQSLLVVGAGAIGLELGSVFESLGSSVLILETESKLLPALHPSFQPFIKRAFQNLNIQLSAQMVRAENRPDGVFVVYTQNGEEKTFFAEKVIVAVGRTPSFQGLGLENLKIFPNERGFLTSCPTQKLWAMGDVAGNPMLAHKAYAEAQKIANAILTGEDLCSVDLSLIPQVIYTHPEIAFFGEKASAVHKAYFQGNARALCCGEADGMAQIFSDKEGYITGAQMVGALAGELIYPLLIAKQNKIKIKDFKEIIPAHPTFSEILPSALSGF